MVVAQSRNPAIWLAARGRLSRWAPASPFPPRVSAGSAGADARVLLAAGAGAGQATAFNAPIAGLVFVLEELVERFDHRIAVATLAALATAIPVARLFLGDAPDFQVESLNYARPESVPLFFVLGAIAGLLAIAYNRALLARIAARDYFVWLTIELRAGLIGRSQSRL
jgi:chloride channel protein, CIC family